VNSDSANYANDLNRFYARFDCHDFGREREEMRGILVADHEQKQSMTVQDGDVLKLLKQVKPSKAAGPDGILPK
ncbi:hypothetical protein BaRGS_00000892, partial [Batillaria attramentaria]